MRARQKNSPEWVIPLILLRQKNLEMPLRTEEKQANYFVISPAKA